MQLGHIVWVEFPAGAGRAQAGRHPAAILQNASATSQLPTILVVPLTTQIAALRYPGTFLIEPDSQNGLRKPSVAMVFQLTAIDQKFVGQSLGHLSDEALAAASAALNGLTFDQPQS